MINGCDQGEATVFQVEASDQVLARNEDRSEEQLDTADKYV